MHFQVRGQFIQKNKEGDHIKVQRICKREFK